MNKVVKSDYHEFIPSVVAGIERPPKLIARLASLLVIFFCIITISWMVLAKVDIVVTSQGSIVPAGKTRTIQATEDGIVKEIYVSEGTFVKQGDPLLGMDSTSPISDEQQLTDRFYKAELAVQRLKIELGETLTLGEGSNASEELVLTELALLKSNLASNNKQINLLQHELEQSESALETAKAEAQKIAITVQHLGSKVNEKRIHSKKGLIPRLEYIDMIFQLDTAKQDMHASQSKIKEQEYKAIVSKERVAASKLDRRSRLYNELTETKHNLSSIEQELVKIRMRISYQLLRAPVTGVVQKITVNSIGSVVNKSQELMTIVPDFDKLDMEVEILNKDIGFVGMNKSVNLKIDAFEYTRYGTLPGKIEWLGTDAVVNSNKETIYPARINLEETILPNVVSNRVARVLPGMSATVDIVIGQRRLIEYFLGPILRYRDEALNER